MVKETVNPDVDVGLKSKAMSPYDLFGTVKEMVCEVFPTTNDAETPTAGL